MQTISIVLNHNLNLIWILIKKYKVDFFETIPEKYGEQLIANKDGFKVSLPTRYNKFFPMIDG